MTGITQNVGISIHAPVKGATETVAAGSPALVISIHAPVKGATRHAGRRCCRTGYFNPRSREGSDGYMTGITQNVGISIHAPVKGATETVAAGSPALVISIHAPVKGAT